MAALAFALLTSEACKAPGADGRGGRADPHVTSPWFRDVAQRVGLDFTYRSYGVQRYWLPETTGGGAGFCDLDGDGRLDVYLLQAGDLETGRGERPGNRLFANRPDGTFEDVTERAGVGDRGYGMGCACADYDNDGDVDLFVTNLGPDVLYRNEGDGTFTDATVAAGLGDEGWGVSSAFVDIDADGYLDLAVVRSLAWKPSLERPCVRYTHGRDYCGPNTLDAPSSDLLYRNRGDGTFEDVSEATGWSERESNGLGIACADFDGDGDIDVYVANDGRPNHLWLNDGEWRFTERALVAGCSVNGSGAAEASMGVAAVDIEDDGDFDLFMTHLNAETNTFYLNEGGLFRDTTHATGMSQPSLHPTGFGMGFADFDLDGLVDLYVANGRVYRLPDLHDPADPYAEPDQVFRSTAAGRFEEIAAFEGSSVPIARSGRGAAFGDWDEDGDIDVLVVNVDAPVQLFENIAERKGHWASLRVLDRHRSDALGAVVRVKSCDRSRWRNVQAAYSYLSSNDPRIHVGLGDCERIDEVVVRWVDGTSTTYGPLAVDRQHVVRRPRAP